jgi:hypothetical protein
MIEKENERQKKEIDELSMLLDQEKVKTWKLWPKISSLSDNMILRNKDYQ